MRLSSIFILLSLCVSLFHLCSLSASEDDSKSVSPSDPIPFNFYAYFEGEWSVTRSVGTISSSEFESSSIEGHYIVEKLNGTSSLGLIGRYYENDTYTGEIDNELKVKIEFLDFSSGSFLTGDDDENLKELFRFSFSQSNPNSIPAAIGEWNSDKSSGSSFLFQCITPTVFSLTVNSNPSSTVTLYTGRKIVSVVVKSFLQQYGSYLAIGGFFLFNMYVKSKAAMTQTRTRTAGLTLGGDRAVVDAATPTQAKKDD